jgi:NAD(P)-dependent dehydrogenase (short-subunit alcohol dehydrogenase family)
MTMERVCVVVGAGPGIGLAVAHRFAKEGYRPVLMARRVERLDALAAHMHAAGIDVFTIGADAAEPGAMEWAFQEIREKVGPVDVLIYNAAAATPAPPTALDPELLVKDFRTGVVGALACVQQVAEPMRAAGRGTIILTGGGFAIQPMAAMASLGVSKAGIRNLAHSLAEELGPSGIHVATVTVMGQVKPGTPFDPDRIAEVYWELHQQPQDSWKTEVQFTGS